MPAFHETRDSRRGLVALAFVFLTLVALVAVPVVIQQRVDALRDVIEVAEPARTLVARVQFAVAREATALEHILEREMSPDAVDYQEAYEIERATLVELAPLVARLGPEPVRRLDAMRAALVEWHGRTDGEVPDGGADGDAARARAVAEAAVLREQVIEAAVALDRAILDATRAGRARIQQTEVQGITLTVLLGVLALAAAALVAALHARVGRYAAEADARREEAEAALAEAAQATEARRRLVRGITHDVKNPLGAAKGYAELLALGVKAPIAPEQVPLVDGVKRTIDHALAIITDLLDVERVDAGALAIHPAPTDLAGVVQAAVEDHRAVAEAAGHRLVLVAGVASLTVRTDGARVRQVLDNLLSNAVKYTPAPGRIAVHLEAPGGGVARCAEVRVADSGPGIPAARREAVFDEFTRLDEGSGARGHGIGLAVARRIARLLGGDLVLAEPAAEGGATFVLRLPADGPRDGRGGDRLRAGARAG